VKKLRAVLLLASACFFAPIHYLTGQAPEIHVETGTLLGAQYRIDMPPNWNGVLLVYYHGYSEDPIAFSKDKPNPLGTGFARLGYALAQSAYSVTGWAVEHAIPETEALRQYTIAHYGQPKETYVLGHSMGGILTAATIESYPNRYDGALSFCGLLEPTTWAIERAAAMRAAFDFYYPGVLPGPVGIPASVPLDNALAKKVFTALPDSPTGEEELMTLEHLKKPEDLAWGIVFSTYVLRDLEQKIGTPVVDNHNFIYAGGADDNALNDGVKRYTAPDKALNYLKTWYTPSGILSKPMLAVHTTYDPIIPAETVSVYADLAQRAGSSRNFVQQYVKADGHCNFTPAETVAALNELIEWKRHGTKPPAGRLPVPEQAK
jgi:pimeloyl-ACP methyl ester carboxylesterase